MLHSLVMLLVLGAAPTKARIDPCYKNAETKAQTTKNAGMPVYLELIGAYSTPKSKVTASPTNKDAGKTAPAVDPKARTVELILLRDGEDCLALVNLTDGKLKRRGLGDDVRCAADGHIQLRLQRLFNGTPPSGPGNEVNVSIWGDTHGRSLDITMEEKDAAGAARRQVVQLARAQPTALERYWRELVARRAFVECVAQSAEPK